MRDATIAARVPVDLRDNLLDLARRRGVDLSTIVRAACRHYADTHANGGTGWAPQAHVPLRANPLLVAAPGAARRNDPATSKAAALDVAPRAGTRRARALRAIADAGWRGATTDEVVAALERQAGRRLAVNGIARRVTDLVQAGAIVAAVDSAGNEAVRPTRNGKNALVWVITDHGRAWLAEAEAA